jgi:hypothetical protein
MDQLAWHHVHNEAYRRLGGVAAVNRIDNLKTGIVRGCGAWGVINEPYRVYARTMGFHVDACEVRAPQQKGKTERRVGDCKGLDVQGRRFDGLAGLQSTWVILGMAAFVMTLFVVRESRFLERYRYTCLLAGVVLLMLPVLPGRLSLSAHIDSPIDTYRETSR